MPGLSGRTESSVSTTIKETAVFVKFTGSEFILQMSQPDMYTYSAPQTHKYVIDESTPLAGKDPCISSRKTSKNAALCTISV